MLLGLQTGADVAAVGPALLANESPHLSGFPIRCDGHCWSLAGASVEDSVGPLLVAFSGGEHVGYTDGSTGTATSQLGSGDFPTIAAEPSEMEIRFYEDPDTGLPHIYGHGVTEEEVRQVLRSRGEDLPGAGIRE